MGESLAVTSIDHRRIKARCSIVEYPVNWPLLPGGEADLADGGVLDRGVAENSLQQGRELAAAVGVAGKGVRQRLQAGVQSLRVVVVLQRRRRHRRGVGGKAKTAKVVHLRLDDVVAEDG